MILNGQNRGCTGKSGRWSMNYRDEDQNGVKVITTNDYVPQERFSST